MATYAVYHINVSDPRFSEMATRNKTIEVRICKDELVHIKSGDFIIVHYQKKGKSKNIYFEMDVTKITRYPTFVECFKKIPKDVDFRDIEKEEEKQYGVIAMYLELHRGREHYKPEEGNSEEN